MIPASSFKLVVVDEILVGCGSVAISKLFAVILVCGVLRHLDLALKLGGINHLKKLQGS